jgi:hypothetical protein
VRRGFTALSRFHTTAFKSLLIAATSVATIAGAMVGSTSAGAASRPRAVAPTQRVQFVRTTTQPRIAQAGNLTYHGGPVMQKKSQTYAIFWEPPTLQDGTSAPVSASYNNLMKRYFKDVGGNGLYNINTQYYQTINGPTEYIVNSSPFQAAWVDTSPYPAADTSTGCPDPQTNTQNCLSDKQIRAEVKKARKANAWGGGRKREFFVFTAPGEGSCVQFVCAFDYYCAYHSYFSTGGGTEIIYANMPYGATPITGHSGGVCTSRNTFPNDRDADIEISITSHEHMEAVTDFELNAWYDSDGAENGDKCAYNYGTVNLDGNTANVQWNGHYYLVQQEWDNQVSSCRLTGP